MPTAKEQIKLDRNYEIYQTRKKFDRMTKIMTRYLNGEQFNVLCHAFELSPNRASNVYRDACLLIEIAVNKEDIQLPAGLNLLDLKIKSVAQQNGKTWMPVVADALKKIMDLKIAAINEKYNNSPTPSRKNHELESKACARA